jgi:hypothetical protein
VFARFAIIGLALLMSKPVSAGERFALLIGNQAYAREVGQLANPINDVHLLAEALKRAGFKAPNIEIVTDADRKGILAATDRYADRLALAGDKAIGFFYYSGHGAARQRDRRNFLLPVDIPRLDAAAWYDSVALDTIIEKLSNQAPGAAQFIIFDACRNILKAPVRGAKGFQPVAARRGMLIAFSTDPGETASDAGEGGGPYATALAAEIVKPGQNHLDMFQNVKERVFKATTTQVPWERNGLLARIYLSENEAKPKQAAAAADGGGTTSNGAAFPFDGLWLGQFCALRTRRSAKKCFEISFDVRNGKLTGSKGSAGKPGHVAFEGKIRSDGKVSISLKGISKVKHRYGRAYDGQLHGRTQKNEISASGTIGGGRDAVLKIERF